MNTILVLLAQTREEAAVEIISMLVGAAFIGYITSWLYCKSVFEKKIKIEVFIKQITAPEPNFNWSNKAEKMCTGCQFKTS